MLGIDNERRLFCIFGDVGGMNIPVPLIYDARTKAFHIAIPDANDLKDRFACLSETEFLKADRAAEVLAEAKGFSSAASKEIDEYCRQHGVDGDLLTLNQIRDIWTNRKGAQHALTQP